MADTIETFVAKLQAEGVQAGQQAAEKLKAEARQQADEIVRQAEARAGKIVEDAEARAAAQLAKGRTELELAARDTAMRLRDALERALKAVLVREARQALADAEFLRSLIRDVVLQYVRADIEGKGNIRINVSAAREKELAGWALDQLVHKADGVSIDLRATLAEAGFEYQVDGATVEVTERSVVEALSDLVGPELRRTIAEAPASAKT